MLKQGKDQNPLLQALVMAMLAGGAQQHENTTYNTETQARVPVLQAVLLAVSILVLVGGLWLMGQTLLWAVEYASAPLDMVGLAVVLVAATLAWMLVPAGLARKVPLLDTVGGRLVLVVLAVIGVFGCLNLLQALAESWTWKQSLRAVGGLAMVAASALLVWRFGNELFNPLYPRPPSVDVMREMIASLSGGPAQPVVVERPIPYRQNGKLLDAEPAAPEREEPAPDAPRIHDDFRDMVALVERAGRRGWARDQHIRRPHLRLPSGRPLTRGLFDELVQYAAEWEVITVLGRGMTPIWRMDAAEALAYLRGAWAKRAEGERIGEIQDLAADST